MNRQSPLHTDQTAAFKTWPWLAAMAALHMAWLIILFMTGASSQPLMIAGQIAWSLMGLGLCVWLANGRLPQINLGGEPVQVALLLISSALICVAYSYLQRPWPDEGRWYSFDLVVLKGGLSGFLEVVNQADRGSAMNSPLPSVLRGYALRLLPEGLFYSRLAGCLAPVGLTWATYAMGRRLFDHKTGIMAGWLFMATPYFARIGGAALNDMWISLFFVLALLEGMNLMQRPGWVRCLILGLLLALGMFSKYTMLLICPLLLWTVWQYRRSLGGLVWISLAMLAGLVMFSPWPAFLFAAGVIQGQGEEVYGYSFQAMNDDWPHRWILESVLTRLPSALGLYQFPILGLGCLSIRPLRNRGDLYVVIWALAVFVPVLLTTPDPRYFIPAFPALAIIAVRGMQRARHGRVLMIYALILALGCWYFFAQWQREALLV
jgi:hypothetical protein